MTEQTRRAVAMYFKKLLKSGVHRKQALQETMDEHRVSRASIYNYCKQFKISTR